MCTFAKYFHTQLKQPMTKSIYAIISAIIATMLFSVGCGQRGNGANDSLASDSAKAMADDHAPMLPDTMYESAKAVVYEVDILDSSDLTLKDTKDYYREGNGMTFRKNAMRNADFGGKVTGTPSTIEIAWEARTDNGNIKTKLGTWGGGTGWTGQPTYRKATNEIIISSLCGKVYSLNFDTGKETAAPMDAHNPTKGSPSLDPEFDNLYVGQGIAATESIERMVFDLKKHEMTTAFRFDNKAWRGWSGCDGSAVVVGGYLFWGCENGMLYKYRRSQGKLDIVAAMRYRVNGCAPGIESSLCAYRNYGFFGDNHGNVICVNLNTMKPVWYYDLHDDIDASIVCCVEDGKPFLYAACEVDRQGHEGICHFVKLNALDGSQIWEQQIPCKRITIGEKTLDGGMFCTPLPGTGNCKDLIFANICRNGIDGAQGEFTAFNRKDGSITYKVKLNNFAWSSPVGFTNEKDELFIFTGDASGYLYIIRGSNGEVLFSKLMGNNMESSPLVLGNAAVVGMRQNGIRKYILK